VRVTRQRDEAERLAKATVNASSAKPTYSTNGAENREFVILPESWLDRIRLGFPRANSW
jgi:hypothetical protein